MQRFDSSALKSWGINGETQFYYRRDFSRFAWDIGAGDGKTFQLDSLLLRRSISDHCSKRPLSFITYIGHLYRPTSLDGSTSEWLVIPKYRQAEVVALPCLSLWQIPWSREFRLFATHS